eukprot:scaffold15559_cov66-Phaeocystis_antarctica.AAC.5
MWEFEAHKDYSHYIFYLYVGEGHIARQPGHPIDRDKQHRAEFRQHRAQLQARGLDQRVWTRVQPTGDQHVAPGPGAMQRALQPRQPALHPARSRETAPYIKPKLNTAPHNLGSPHDSRHDPEAALYNKPIIGLN